MSRSVYFDRYAAQQKTLEDHQLREGNELIVVVPSFKETHVDKAIQSLMDCQPPKGPVTVIVVINQSENADPETDQVNEESIQKLQKLNPPDWVDLQVTKVKLATKKAGVGLARKIGMDAAARLLDESNRDGIIICYDADCSCESNYLIEIEKKFQSNKVDAAIVFHEHPLDSNEIIQYESYLRYYVNALRYTGFPYAYQTLGSCITVKSTTYQKVGGMNTRKAGEDFYFLHKIIPNIQFDEINSTTIYPSGRVSERVPFGTGMSVKKIQEQQNTYAVYHWKIFEEIRELIKYVPQLKKSDSIEHLSPELRSFLNNNDFSGELKKIRSHGRTEKTFQKRFYNWLDGFRILKLVHHLRDEYYGECDLEEALSWLNNNFLKLTDFPQELLDQLIAIRKFDRQ